MPEWNNTPKTASGGITVSVIIPVYNKSPYIIDCLNSVVGQTYQNLEVLVIDDGSTDDSWEKLRRYVERWGENTAKSCVHLFQIPHSGPSAARNKGLEEATGEFVTFLDADDFLEPGYIEHLVGGIGNADLCLSGHKVWFQREDRWVEEKCSPGSFRLSDHSMKRALGGIGWKLYSLPFLRAHNITFQSDIDQGEDTLFTSVALFHALSQTHSSKITCIDRTEYIVRRHDLSSQIHQLVSIEVEERVIAKYKELEKQAADEKLKEYYRAQQISHLAVVGRIICYQDMPMKERKLRFFSLANKYKITGLYADHPAQFVTSLSLLTHTFLPFYIITKLFYWKSELRGRYDERGGNRLWAAGEEENCGG